MSLCRWLWLLGCSLCLIASARAQTTQATQPTTATSQPSDRFPFYIPWDEAVPGTATDVSFMNDKPAGKHGRVILKDGHPTFADSGQRVRFFATNIAGEAAFPEKKEDADAIAKSLAKRGINLVRLHHLDNPWAIGHGSIWAKGDDRQHLDPAMLDRLDYLVSKLIENGIYVNLNLKVSKELTAADGFPAEAIAGLKANFPHQKRVDHFDRKMIDLQKSYAHDLLTHVNPYLKRSYIDEPGIAIVEVNNENSLITLWPGQPLGNGLEGLPDYFRKELGDLWNAWLKKKYPDDKALLAAWNKEVEPLGPSTLPSILQWASEQHEKVRCSINVSPSRTVDTAPNLTVRVSNPDKTDWHAQAVLRGLTLPEHHQYTLSFEARSDKPRDARVSASLDQAPYSVVGLSEAFGTGPTWKPYTFTFTAADTVPSHVRLSFAVGGSDTPLQVHKLMLKVGSPSIELNGQSLASGSIALPPLSRKTQRDDFISFLVDTDVAYGKEMLSFLRNDLHVHSLLYVSQVQWGGTAGYLREADSDIVDTHGYIHHPQFAKAHDWSPTDWTIANQSDLIPLAESRKSVLSDIAKWRQAGKPFSVSEFDEPAPSDYAAEAVPMLAAMAAAQDWDAIYTFCLPDYGAGQSKHEQITGFFDHLNHTAKAAFYPFAAVAFRTGGEPMLESASTVTLPAESFLTTPTVESAWAQVAPAIDPLSIRVAVEPGQKTLELKQTMGKQPSPLSLSKTPAGPVLRISGPLVAGLVGFVGGSTSTAGPLSIEIEAHDNNFAVATVHTLDGLSIDRSSRAVLTILSRAENVDMGWNATRTSVANHWGTGPVQVVGVRGKISIARMKAAHVYPLDVHGKRAGEVPATYVDGKVQFAVSPEQRTVWYEITD